MLLRPFPLHCVHCVHCSSANPRSTRHIARAVTGQARQQVQSPPLPEPIEHRTSNVSTDSSSAVSTSGCPFLASLSTPAVTSVPWYKRLQQLSNPVAYQQAAYGDHLLVKIPAALGLPLQYSPSSGDLIKQILTGENDIIYKTHNFTKHVGPLLGPHAISTVPDPKHRYLRTLMQPAFTNEAVGKMVPLLVSVMKGYLDRWSDAGGVVLAHSELKDMTYDVIVKVVFGHELPAGLRDQMSKLYAEWGDGVTAWPFINLPFTPYGRALRARGQLLEIYQQLLDDARQELAAGGAVQGVLGSLITAQDDDGNRLSDAEIKDNVLLLLLAGHGTTNTSLTQVLVQLHKHPQVLDKLRQEQQQLMGKHGPELTAAVVRAMPYTDAVIKETLRLHTVVHGLNRVAARDFELGGYLVPQGMELYLPLAHIAHEDPRWTDEPAESNLNPRRFSPERFLALKGQKRGWQMPFGHGSRHCLGYTLAMAEMRVFLALLARGYNFTADPGTEYTCRVGHTPKNLLPMTVMRLA
eukprot:GHUV01048343.1.p1 GENE.GHUV01048343.1~~GHUV01048343.1.p1  ORF type:complete len:522 (+),score=119.33 GHUV01048343.1:83-1648(+)